MKMNILCVGNSILHHGPSEALGWKGDWGMAASCRENDYFHLLQKGLEERFPEIEFVFRENNAYALENGIRDDENKDYTEIFNQVFGESLKVMIPDVVLLQCGDNCKHDLTTDTAYANAMKQVIKMFRDINPEIQVVMCLPWYGELVDSKQIGTLIASRDVNCNFVNLNKHHIRENTAHGLFEHDGVQEHPGDKGMRAIADTFIDAVTKIINKEVKYPWGELR